MLDGFLFVFLIWLTHSLALVLHEYGHSLTAWALGWKLNPLAITYGHATLPNLAFLSDFDENVDYDPIFAAGKGYQASLIALAGILVNAIFYFISRVTFTFGRNHTHRTIGVFAFLFCLMNLGNFLDYVPERTFTTHADIATFEKGLRMSPWAVLVMLGIPFAIAIAHFFAVLLPRARAFLFPKQFAAQAILVTVSAFGMFVYYGGTGIHGYGAISHWISVVSTCVGFPVTLIACWPRAQSLASLPA